MTSHICIYIYTYDIHMHVYQNTNSAKFQISSEHSTDCPVAFQDSRTQSTLDTIFWCYQAWCDIDQCTPELKLPRSMLLVCLQNNGKNSTSAKVFGRAMSCCTKMWLEMQFIQNRGTFANNMAIICSIFVPNMKQPSMNSKESALRLVFLALFGCVL